MGGEKATAVSSTPVRSHAHQSSTKVLSTFQTKLIELRRERLALDAAERNELDALQQRRAAIIKRFADARVIADAKIVAQVLSEPK